LRREGRGNRLYRLNQNMSVVIYLALPFIALADNERNDRLRVLASRFEQLRRNVAGRDRSVPLFHLSPTNGSTREHANREFLQHIQSATDRAYCKCGLSNSTTRFASVSQSFEDLKLSTTRQLICIAFRGETEREGTHQLVSVSSDSSSVDSSAKSRVETTPNKSSAVCCRSCEGQSGEYQ